jgi:LmbE family N-acetylglucosaminyl deacetylase/GT2 family glycosyltransferase
LENLLVPYEAASSLPGSRVLVLAPHPDDEVFGCGGALARHAEQGATITVVILTDGAYGAAADQAEAVRETRRAESRAAAAVLGYGEPRFLGLPDRGLSYGEPLIDTLKELLGETEADLVYAPSLHEMHPDHRSLGMAAFEAVRRLGGERKLAFYEVGVPLQPNHFVDITPVLSRKAEAMACFRSQILIQRYDQHIAALNRYRTYTLPAEVTAAEAFRVVDAQALTSDPLDLYRNEHQKQRALGLPLVPTDLPLVSVLVRSMDRDALAQALDSVALQTYPNIEVVVVNASGHAHRALGEWCGRFPLRMVEPGKPLGRSAAANAALDAARGELLMFLDDDDRYLAHHIAALKTALDEGGANTIAAYDGVSCIDVDGKEVHRYQRAFDRFVFSLENFIPIHAVLFRRTALERGARFDENQAYCEDWDFWLQVQDFGEFRLLPELGAIYRVGKGEGSGLWGDADLARASMLQVYRKRVPTWDDAQLQRLIDLTHYKPAFERAVNELERSKEQVARLEPLVTTLERELKHALEQFTAAQEREAELHSAITERDMRIAALYNSTSWKLTAPVRWITSRLRRAMK